MRKIVLVIFLLNSLFAISQQQRIISFDYDAAGNQTKRQLCVSCQSKDSNETAIPVDELQDSDLLKFFPEDIVSYYPNPVKEELFLKWELIDNKNVVSMELYSLSGQLVKKFTNFDTSNKFNISFLEFPIGVYNLLLRYSNGEQKDIRIIKK